MQYNSSTLKEYSFQTKNTLNARTGDQCSLNGVSVHSNALPFLHADLKHLKVVRYNIILQLMQCKMFVCWLICMTFHVQMTIYWCVTKNGLINSRLWIRFMLLYMLGNIYLRYFSIWILFKFYIPLGISFMFMIEKQQSYLIFDMKLLKWCHAIFSLLLRVLCTG